jgi:asparagine synthase (glutamine-hydrolysing)
MTALAGLWKFSASPDLEPVVTSMVRAQRRYGPHGSAAAILETVAFGRALYRLLPEDRFDTQPLIGASRTLMLVADVRIDNRDELLDELGCARGAELSDADLVLKACEAWGDQAPEKIIGDFAFALWNARENSLTLARDTAGQRPLHYHVGPGFVAFASMPEALHDVPEVPRQLDVQNLASFVSGAPRAASSTFYRGISRVEPGQIVKITPDRTDVRHYWRFPDREIRYAKSSDYADALREQLDRATRARLRGVGGVVGTHLSAGLDSGAVSATAARLMAQSGGTVTAFTSAPRSGFDGAGLPGRIGDESGLAAQVAAQFPNMTHIVVRPEGVSPLDILGRDTKLFQEPVGHPCNFVWWSRVHDEAQSRGISVMLTGEAGNLTLSAGGLATLAEFVRTGQWLRWAREARMTIGTGPTWRGVLATSFGPWMPTRAWRALTRLFGPPTYIDFTSLLHPDMRSGIEERAAEQAGRGPPEKDDRQLRWQLLHRHEPGNFRKGILARWGIDERDPTADRRLADFCFALPPEQLYSGGVNRRLARVALADRLPDAVLNGPRGYQYPDWYEGMDKARLERVIAELEHGPAALLLDFSRLRGLVASWPTQDWNTIANIGTYRMAFLAALSAGTFANQTAEALDN